MDLSIYLSIYLCMYLSIYRYIYIYISMYHDELVKGARQPRCVRASVCLCFCVHACVSMHVRQHTSMD